MTKAETIAPDGSWKVVVEAFKTSVLFFYSAIGVTTHVYVPATQSWWDKLWGLSPGWSEANADSVAAAGLMSSSQFPIAQAPLPGSPNVRRNDSSADCRAWAVGASVTFEFGADGVSVVGGSAGIQTIVDVVRNGTGSAVRSGLTLSAGPVSWP